MVSPTIISLVIDSALAAMQVKNHFDVKNLQRGVAQLLGELPIEETRADSGEFTRLLYLLRFSRGEKTQMSIVMLMGKLDTAERNVFRALVASRRSPNYAHMCAEDMAPALEALDKERLDFLADLADMAENDMEEALLFLRTGVGITPKPGVKDIAATYMKFLVDFIARETPRIVGWIKYGALKTHAAIFNAAPRKQSIVKTLLGKLLVGSSGGTISTSSEIQFLNQLFASKAKTVNETEV